MDILSEIINERSVMKSIKESRRWIIHSHDAIIKRPDRDQFDYNAIDTVNEVQKNSANLIWSAYKVFICLFLHIRSFAVALVRCYLFMCRFI